MGFCRPEALTDGSIVGTPIHMPAEIFNGQYTQAIDIYAFGILFWYILRNNVAIPRAYEDCPTREELWRKIARGVRPEKIDRVDEGLWLLIEACWAHAPETRPKAGDIYEVIEIFQKNLQKKH